MSYNWNAPSIPNYDEGQTYASQQAGQPSSNIAGNAAAAGLGAITGSSWLTPVIGGVGAALGGIFGEDQKYPESYDVNPGQRALWNKLYGQYQSGAGDFGGGSTAKSGYANLMQMLGGRGIDPRSGAAIGGMANVASNAASTDAMRRDQWTQSLLNNNLQQATRYV